MDTVLDYDAGELMPSPDAKDLSMNQVDLYIATAMLTSH